MAGGYGRGSGIPLRDRVRVDQPRDRTDTKKTQLPSPGRHCWITLPADAGEPRLGLLLRWEHRSAGWAGEVVYSAQLRPGEWATVTEWLASHLLTTSPPDVTSS